MYPTIYILGAFVILFIEDLNGLEKLEFEVVWAWIHVIFYYYPIIQTIIVYIMNLAAAAFMLFIIHITTFADDEDDIPTDTVW